MISLSFQHKNVVDFRILKIQSYQFAKKRFFTCLTDTDATQKNVKEDTFNKFLKVSSKNIRLKKYYLMVSESETWSDWSTLSLLKNMYVKSVTCLIHGPNPHVWEFLESFFFCDNQHL